MTPEQLADLENSATAAEQAAAEAGGTDEALNTAATEAREAFTKAKAPTQKSKHTEAEKAAYTLKSNAARAKELGLDPAEILGVKTHIETDVEDEDDKPVTVGMMRKMQKKEAQTSALQLADGVADLATRAQVKEYLADRIVPSGDADADFRLALAAASAEKNKEVRAVINAYVAPKRTAAGGSAPAHLEEDFTPTAEEQFHMKSFGLTKEKVLAARKRSAEKGH